MGRTYYYVHTVKHALFVSAFLFLLGLTVTSFQADAAVQCLKCPAGTVYQSGQAAQWACRRTTSPYTAVAATTQTCSATQVCKPGEGCVENTLNPGQSGVEDPTRDDIPQGSLNFSWNQIAPRNVPIGDFVLQNTLNTALAILATAGTVGAILYLVYSGIRWITSGGDKEQIASAQRGVTYAIVGIIIIALSAVIINIIGSILGISYGV